MSGNYSETAFINTLRAITTGLFTRPTRTTPRANLLSLLEILKAPQNGENATATGTANNSEDVC